MKLFSKVGKYLLLEAIFFLILGICLLFAPWTTVKAIIYVTAAFMAVYGIINIFSFIRLRKEASYINHFMMSGVLQLVFAIILFRFPESVAVLLPIGIGIVVLLSSISNMIYAIDIRSEIGSKWVWILIYGIISAAAGLFIIFNPFSGMSVVTIACGILMIFRSAGNIWVYFVLHKIKKQMP